MKLAIFGASGATGRLLVQQALAAGHDVTVLLRSAGSLSLDSVRLQRIVGQLDQPDAIAAVVQGADAVISVLGVRKGGAQTVCTDGIRSILQAMQHTGTQRLIALSAYGASETQHDSWFIRLVRKIIREKMRDKDGMENLVRASTTDWTLVRPPALTNGAAMDDYRASTSLKPGVAGRLSRADLAGFMLSVAESGDYLHQAPVVSL
ncbi:NAD(P)H-binding protein [Duganella sp. FT109W]|uniref:NAD(P)H-binding protein n=1 Tax=Duganella margarita TaxID=2692170 RepID=A0ABW9WBW1_9BURK|nr:NAD(P)H-binding protein [Duganella margarita]MYN37975.1 NAD(P)H-binding protein [Duganella margarita]